MNKQFKEWVKEYPIQFFAPIIILIFAGLGWLIENELIKDVLLFITWVVIGAQWLSIHKSIITNIKERKKTDIKRFEDFAGSYPFKVTFLVPYEGSIIRKICNKLSKKISLSMYVHDEISIQSFTKYHVTKKELFNLKLNGYINTNNMEIAKKGIKYIEGKK